MAYACYSLSDLRSDGSISYQDRQNESGDGHQHCQLFAPHAKKAVEEDILLEVFGVICESTSNLEAFLSSWRR